MKESTHDLWWIVSLVVVMSFLVVWVVAIERPFERLSQAHKIEATISTEAPMPTKIELYGSMWRIHRVHFGDRAQAGMTLCREHEIAIADDDDDARTTILHELMHASVCGYDARRHAYVADNLFFNSTTNAKHEGIYHASEVIGYLLQHNPSLALYEAGAPQ